MSAIAWIGLLTAALKEAQLKALLLPLVAFAAGSLLGGALLHLLPEAIAAGARASKRSCPPWEDSRCSS
jgi:zinc and cadmium transporter